MQDQLVKGNLAERGGGITALILFGIRLHEADPEAAMAMARAFPSAMAAKTSHYADQVVADIREAMEKGEAK